MPSPQVRKLRKKSEKFHQNIEKRGNVSSGSTKKESSLAVGPVVIGFFLFVVVGSALLQIIRAAV